MTYMLNLRVMTVYIYICCDRPMNINRSDYISPWRNNIRARPEMMKPFFDLTGRYS